MTVIAYRDGVMAADSRVTIDTEAGGIRHFKCEKLFRKAGAIIATAGESAPGIAFVDWYRSGREKPDILVHGDADFVCLVLQEDGRLYEYDKWLVGEEIKMPKRAKFYAIGSGAKAALGAMHMGADAKTACAVACKIDPFCDLPIVTMALKDE